MNIRAVVTKISSLFNRASIKSALPLKLLRQATTISSHEEMEIDMHIDDFQYQKYLNNPEIDGWDTRRCMNELAGIDCVPHPQVIIAGLKAARRLNDIALAIRFLETCRDKTGSHFYKIYPYMMQEILPTIEELGIGTLESMGFTTPQLALKSVYDMKPPGMEDEEEECFCEE